jgi:hypothetical protein
MQRSDTKGMSAEENRANGEVCVDTALISLGALGATIVFGCRSAHPVLARAGGSPRLPAGIVLFRPRRRGRNRFQDESQRT